jgi:hypothetical protein
MKRNQFHLPMARLTVSAFIAFGTIHSLRAATANMASVDVFVTNRVSRVITNLVEVRMPLNVFFNEYRTNLVEQYRTNVVDVYRTNWLQRTLTNTITVQRTQTNWVSQYQTNLNAFSLTNWQTVVVFKTNWVSQTVTNLVELNLPLRTAVASPVISEPASPVQILGQAQDFQIELVRTEKPSDRGQVEVELALRCTKTPAPAFAVQDWQLVRPDGTVLMFGQRPQFKAELASGKYKMVVKVRRGDKTTPIAVTGEMQINEGTVQRTLLPKFAGLN